MTVCDVTGATTTGTMSEPCFITTLQTTTDDSAGRFKEDAVIAAAPATAAQTGLKNPVTRRWRHRDRARTAMYLIECVTVGADRSSRRAGAHAAPVRPVPLQHHERIVISAPWTMKRGGIRTGCTPRRESGHLATLTRPEGSSVASMGAS